MISIRNRLRGKYVGSDLCQQHKWIKPSFFIIHINYFSVFVVVITAALALNSVITEDSFDRIYKILSVKDGIILLSLFILTKRLN